MSKVVYLIEQPLDERNYDRFGIQSWISRGWTVEIWDLTPLAYPRVWRNFIESGHQLSDFEGYFPIATREQIERRFSRLEKLEFFIDLTADTCHAISVKMRLARLGAGRVTCVAGSIPALVIGRERDFPGKLRRVFSRTVIDAVIGKVAAPFIRPALVVVTGEQSIPAHRPKLKILRAHNLDYDIYLRLRSTSVVSSAKYAVFLDQNICFHPEYIYGNVPSYATAEKYFPTLCNGLRRISEALELPFTIAAHPRLPRQGRCANYFGTMPVEYGKTAELISNSEFVVCHFTTAIQFAVLFKKPVIFVTTNELAGSSIGRYIAKFASTLGKTVIDLDGDLNGLDWQKELNIDSRKYDEYRQQYIKTDGSPESPYWDIVADYVEKVRSRLSADSTGNRPPMKESVVATDTASLTSKRSVKFEDKP